ncbi:MAG: terminase small subunit [Cyanobacteriota bacterium]|nr:terminase small subunit [Cyanobacteriota bacterium]MDY6364361.1 terminase small subunit [Cyanobacteriota bacterium]
MNNLPKLTAKQQKFVLRYLTNGNNATKAYRFAYDCQGSSNATVSVEANKLLKNPNVALWIKQAQENIQEVFKDELKYSALDCFNELADLQERCSKSNKTYNVEKGCIELKGKLAGLFVDKLKVTGGGLADVLDKLK